MLHPGEELDGRHAVPGSHSLNPVQESYTSPPAPDISRTQANVRVAQNWAHVSLGSTHGDSSG